MDVIFERKFYGKMLEWKEHLADKYALLVEGARRTPWGQTPWSPGVRFQKYR